MIWQSQRNPCMNSISWVHVVGHAIINSCWLKNRIDCSNVNSMLTHSSEQALNESNQSETRSHHDVMDSSKDELHDMIPHAWTRFKSMYWTHAELHDQCDHWFWNLVCDNVAATRLFKNDMFETDNISICFTESCFSTVSFVLAQDMPNQLSSRRFFSSGSCHGAVVLEADPVELLRQGGGESSFFSSFFKFGGIGILRKMFLSFTLNHQAGAGSDIAKVFNRYWFNALNQSINAAMSSRSLFFFDARIYLSLFNRATPHFGNNVILIKSSANTWCGGWLNAVTMTS